MFARSLLACTVSAFLLMGGAPLVSAAGSSQAEPPLDSPVKVPRLLYQAKRSVNKNKAAVPRHTVVSNVRTKVYPGYTRFVLDLDHSTTFTQSRQSHPDRAIIELQNSRLGPRLQTKLSRKKLEGTVTVAQPHPQSVTVSLNLEQIGDYRLMVLSRPDRLVVDAYPRKEQEAGAAESDGPGVGSPAASPGAVTVPVPPGGPAAATPSAAGQIPSSSPLPSAPTRLAQRPARDVKIIVIDPGHGGKDPGAIGRLGTAEKDVTLRVGRRLRDLLIKYLGARVLMTRERDVFVELDDRAKFANSKDADLFVSIHVNSHPQRSTKGLEVYHFGQASDRRALEVAARENGTPLENAGGGWQYILADFVTSKKIERSQELAWTTKQTMVAHLDDHYEVVDHGVKTAPFYVIRFTTMPSILAEIAFISNPVEERLMRSETFLNRMADAIFQGIRSYIQPVQTAAR